MQERVRARARSVASVVDALGGEIREAADWRTQVTRHPYWAMGTAAGVGLLAAVFVRGRRAPQARLRDAAAGSLEALAGRLRDPAGSHGRVSRLGAAGLVRSVVGVWVSRALRQRLAARAAKPKPDRTVRYDGTAVEVPLESLRDRRSR
jgi:hypothetical protein